jgi:hypothetical protein
MRLVDPRAGRFEQAIVVVVLLAGFVFQQRWSIPIAAFVAGTGAVMAERSPLARFWNDVVAPRRPARSPFEPAAVAQSQSFLLFVGLALATLLMLADAIALASIVAAVVAVVGALGATGVVNAAAEIRRRSSRG